MYGLALCLFLIGTWPVAYAAIANRRWTIFHALTWAILAWIAWTSVVAVTVFGGAAAVAFCRYLALSLTGCCGVAVLGARRPGAAAWNFIVLGLLAVMLLPAAEKFVLGNDTLGWMRWLFLAAAVMTAVANYLPTRFWAAALLTAAGCGWESFLLIFGEMNPAAIPAGWICLALVPWVACGGGRRRREPDSALVDSVWRQFRDRYGVFWGERIRDQFNRAAENAGLHIAMRWSGIIRGQQNVDGSKERQAREILEGLLRRFRREKGTKQKPLFPFRG